MRPDSQSSPEQVLTALRDRATVRTEVSFAAGSRVRAHAAALAAATGLPERDWLAALDDPARFGAPDGAVTLEGLVLAGDYVTDPGQGVDAVIRGLLDESARRLAELGVAAEAAHDTLTLASLIDAEAQQPELRGRIAQVLRLRLDAEEPLLVESTAVYHPDGGGAPGLGVARGLQSSYSTFQRPGLPPGPILTPSAAAVEAALAPASGTARFFIMTNPETGETEFTEDATGYQLGIETRSAWCQESPERPWRYWRCN